MSESKIMTVKLVLNEKRKNERPQKERASNQGTTQWSLITTNI